MADPAAAWIGPMNVIPRERQIAIISALTEGCTIRANERMTGVHRDTIMRLGVRVGDACTAPHDRLYRNLSPNLIELDEMWAFVGKKQKLARKFREADKGNQPSHRRSGAKVSLRVVMTGSSSRTAPA